MFLIRAAFWLSLVVLFLPAEPGSNEPAPGVSAFEAVSAARATAADLSTFCDRNPDVCATGSTALQVFAQKVRYGAHLIRGYFDGQAEDTPPGTLRREDVAAPWRGPVHDGAA